MSSGATFFKNIKGNAPLLPGCETRSFHNYSLYYGVELKLPFKYSPIIKLYKGSTRTYYQGDGSLATHGKDFNIFELRRAMYGCELVFPMKIILPNYFLTEKLGISIYGEYCNFYKSSFYFYDGAERKNISLSSYTDNSFRTKYKNEFYYGFKLSFSIS